MQTLFTIQTIGGETAGETLFLVIPVLGRREYDHTEFVFSDLNELRLFLYIWHADGAAKAIRRYDHLERLTLWHENYG